MGITLTKKQTISLAKESEEGLEKVRLGLGWDVAKPSGFFGKIFGGNGDIDLDASCIMIDKKGSPVDIIYYGQLKSKCKSIVHSGDNRTGQGEGDDEDILVKLNKISPEIEYLVFTVNSFTGQKFNDIENAYCRILDADTNKELAKINLSDQGNHTGLIMAYLKRNGSDWTFTAVGEVCNGRTARDISNEAVRIIL